jgi:hypothetical protein
MEQQLEASFLRPGFVERAAAIGIGAVGIGTGILLSAWGVSLLWRPVPPEIGVRIINPEVRLAHGARVSMEQDKPFVIAPPEPLKIDPARLTVNVERSSTKPDSFVSASDRPSNEVIRREVTAFFKVKHGQGDLVTGWNYKDGSGGEPVAQYCYYTIPNIDLSTKRVDIARDRARLPHVSDALVPDLQAALAKCQWWKA